VNAGAATIRKPWDAKYRVGVADENLGMPRDFAGAKTRAKELLRKRPSGVTIVMERLTSDGEVADKVRFRKITVKPPLPNTEGVEGIDRIVGWVNQESPGRLPAGCVRRRLCPRPYPTARTSRARARS
jgi:hypothetical protein